MAARISMLKSSNLPGTVKLEEKFSRRLLMKQDICSDLDERENCETVRLFK